MSNVRRISTMPADWQDVRQTIFFRRLFALRYWHLRGICEYGPILANTHLAGYDRIRAGCSGSMVLSALLHTEVQDMDRAAFQSLKNPVFVAILRAWL